MYCIELEATFQLHQQIFQSQFFKVNVHQIQLRFIKLCADSVELHRQIFIQHYVQIG